ncbi:MAG: hypothetical protein E7Z91_07335 [Cyanobacteria bacterium SIG30]|nr:hypothetical protein [Cyanobacteria bacterium SIG30]
MIKSIKNTSVYKSSVLGNENSQAYLFYSFDKELNNNIALAFAKSLICKEKCGCESCVACQQFNSSSHPDVYILKQPTIKVDDVTKLMDKLNTKPISADVKVFVILNAENINEISQNKLLKSLEEPNSQNVFILTSSKTDKLLPTVMSRLTKIYVPKLTEQDKQILSKELAEQNVDISKYLNANFTLTEIINFETNEEYKNTLKNLDFLFSNLKTTADIPAAVSKLNNVNKELFFPLMQDLFLTCLNGEKKFEKPLTMLIDVTFNKKALAKCIPLVGEAYKKQMSNVNFGYILDNLLFNILKEKFLCK